MSNDPTANVLAGPSQPGADQVRRTPNVSCVFICHDGDGRVLLARRSAGARDEPGAWDCGAGALEYGESFETAAAREVGEEYTTRPLTIETIGVRNVLREEPPSHWVAVIFAVGVDPTEAAIGEPHKFDELGWFSLDSLPSPMHSQLAESIRLFRAWQEV
ncbi:NUDIX domain-containing protein [Nonomuraea turcica]|uniref:NUDIX domain-containing protein n=1 Tax=Nonomuraea sp. G32 TaxID=3067274 RepID=UPI00273B572B|nr:NUDIX domain-containing protein [Nonomuraea sp. G32]MDP4512008.1 NUDIX domain-containing protein [Nonomuraea sp. G32]